MTNTSKIVCRLHPSTGRLSCRYELTTRPPAGVWNALSDAESAERSHYEAVRRATRRLSELVHDYELRLLWTLTYAAEPEDYPQVAETIRNFTRRARAAGLPTSRMIVPEQSVDGRWHLHLAVPVFVARSLMAQVWGHGFVYAPDITAAQSPDALEKVSGYLTKSFSTTPAGRRRYIAAKGMRPREERFTAPDEATAIAQASQRLGRQPDRRLWYAGNLLAFYPPAEAGAGA